MKKILGDLFMGLFWASIGVLVLWMKPQSEAMDAQVATILETGTRTPAVYRDASCSRVGGPGRPTYNCSVEVSVPLPGGARRTVRKSVPDSFLKCTESSGEVPAPAVGGGWSYWVVVSQDDPTEFVWLPGPCIPRNETKGGLLYLLAAAGLLTGLYFFVRAARGLRARTA